MFDDARDRIITEITRRRGQAAFRSALMIAYGGRCAISGCDVEQALEAAHILPYRGSATNVVRNGLLLRADLHTLFDLNLLWVDAETFVVATAEALSSSEYANFNGLKLRLPTRQADHPDKDIFKERNRAYGASAIVPGD
jgi:predicted restriction endonuclease